MLNILNEYACSWKFHLNKTKTNILISSTEKYKKENYSFYLDNEKLKIIDSAEHVGVPLSNQLKCNVKIDKACKKR